MRGQQLGQLATGEPVHDRPHESHFATHADANPELPALVAEALGQVHSGGFIATAVDLGREVGRSICVPADASEDIVFARRPNRHGLTRFVRGKQPVPTSSVSVVARPREDWYELLTAWVGALAPPEPWDRNATAESAEFWSRHALVWGAEEVIPGTETSARPW